MSDDPPESPKVPKFFDVLFPPPPSPAEQLAADKARFVKLRAGLEHVKTARSELLQCAAIGFCSDELVEARKQLAVLEDRLHFELAWAR